MFSGSLDVSTIPRSHYEDSDSADSPYEEPDSGNSGVLCMYADEDTIGDNDDASYADEAEVDDDDEGPFLYSLRIVTDSKGSEGTDRTTVKRAELTEQQ